ncbi:MAG TPA: hypothetical protein VED17_07955 [Nitrososphaerales archaeon]|nr:hypothetical protein [Nitrososphaerales archaeon]
MVVGILLAIQNALNYPRPFDIIVLGIYNLFVVLHLFTVVSNPLWLFLYLPLTAVEIWIGEGLILFLFFLSVALILGIPAELNSIGRSSVRTLV